jgi:hypothetical protein
MVNGPEMSRFNEPEMSRFNEPEMSRSHAEAGTAPGAPLSLPPLEPFQNGSNSVEAVEGGGTENQACVKAEADDMVIDVSGHACYLKLTEIPLLL